MKWQRLGRLALVVGVVALAVAVSACAAQGQGQGQGQEQGHAMAQLLGGKSGAADTNDARTQEIARFAVQQLSAQQRQGLAHSGDFKLEDVVEVRHQVVQGLNYFLKLRLSDASGAVSVVEATVWERPVQAGSNALPLELTHFKKLEGGDGA